MGPVTVGLLVPDGESSEALRTQIRETGLGTVEVDASEYPRSRIDGVARKFVEVRPDLILIAGEHLSAMRESVGVLHAALPACWIVVSTSTRDERTRAEMLRSGAYQLLPSPLTEESLTQTLRQVQLLSEMLDARQRALQGDGDVRGKVYAVCACKRGAGATTVAINLAASLSELPDAKVALLDLDWPIGDVAAYLNLAPRATVSDAVSSAERLDQVLLESYLHKFEEFQILAGSEEFVAARPFTAEAIEQLLEVSTQNFTYTVIDLSLFLDHQVLEAVMNRSDSVLAVITPELPSLRRAERLLRFMGEGGSEKIRLVLNRVTRADEITERDIQKALQHPVSWKVSNDYRSCNEAVNAGKTLLASKQLGRDFRVMADQLTSGAKNGQGKGLLSLLSKSSASS